MLVDLLPQIYGISKGKIVCKYIESGKTKIWIISHKNEKILAKVINFGKFLIKRKPKNTKSPSKIILLAQNSTPANHSTSGPIISR